MAVSRRGRVVIIGGGPAAAASVGALRELGHEGELVLISEEPHAPYSRPPLSKAFLGGEVQASDLALATADAQLRLRARATHVDFERQTVRLASGDIVPYDGLVIATGTQARRPQTDGVCVLATLDDAMALRSRLRLARSAIVVGSGFLAYEIASAAHSQGIATTLVTKPGALQRRIGSLASALTSRARAAGATVLETASCSFHSNAVTTSAHGTLEADLIVAAIGSSQTSPLQAAHAVGGSPGPVGGVTVDAHLRLRPNVVAAGDVVTVRTPTGLHREATWTNALAQGAAAAASLLDAEAPAFTPVPYAWTEAFGLDIKIAGTPPAHSPITVVEGNLDAQQALVSWDGGAAAIGYRIPVARLKRLAAHGRLSA